MPVLVGLLLAPLGAVVGTTLFLAVFAGSAWLWHGDGSFEGQMLFGMSFYGLILGTVFGAPVTVVALPATYVVLRRRSVTVAKLAIAGALFGFVSVWIVTLLFWKPANVFGNLGTVGFTLAVAADGAAAGAVCGYVFGRITRRLRPEQRHVPASPV